MPVFTTLEFFRSKQTINSFNHMYPKSITGLRETVLDSLETITNMLTEITQQYLNGHKNHESFIVDKLISVRLLLSETETEGLHKKQDFENVIDKAGTLAISLDHINKIKETCQNISEFNPNAFVPMVELFEKILHIMEKYLLSFYTGNIHLCPHKYIETPFNYEKHRLQIIQEVKKKLQKIFTLSNQFNTHGVKMNDLGEKSIHVGRRTQSLDIPCFLLFKENCDLIEESQDLLIKWIEIDKEYTRAIKIDINFMNDEKSEFEIKRRTEYEDFIKSRHLTDQLQRDYNEMSSIRPMMHSKLQKCENESHETLVKIKQNESVIRKTNVMLQEAQRKANDLGYSDELDKEISENIYIIKKFQKILKENMLQHQRIEVKIEWYHKFSKVLSSKRTELDHSIATCSKHKLQLDVLDEKIAILHAYLDHLNSICSLKSSNFTLKKIFHNLNFKDKLSMLPGGQQQKHNPVIDELSNAIQITSQMINKDWITLYMNLPFHPPRGTAEMENDIQKFIKNKVRGVEEDLALQSLNSWRRYHTRSNLTCLVDTLQNIRRFDVLKKLGSVPTSKAVDSVRRIEEEKLPPLSPTTRFLIKHYPNLQKSRHQIV